MAQFMIEFNIVEHPDEMFFQLIPAQRAKIDKLMSEGKILSYTLDATRTKLWCIVNAENEFEAMDLITDFPLIHYMVPTILPLMFHNSVFLSIPKFSVN
jgi:muconolactone delta-isomerase